MAARPVRLAILGCRPLVCSPATACAGGSSGRVELNLPLISLQSKGICTAVTERWEGRKAGGESEGPLWIGGIRERGIVGKQLVSPSKGFSPH